MDKEKPSVFWTDFRRVFLRGLAAVLPTLLTLMIIIYVIRFVQGYFGTYINRGLIFLLAAAVPKVTEEGLRELWLRHWYLRGIGFVLAIVGIYFIGRFAGSLVGRGLWSGVEHGLMRAPLVKQIYSNIKQVTDFLLNERPAMFSRVVAVEYPRRGTWSIGLVTGAGLAAMAGPLGTDLLTVFIPSSPTPVTGYTITVRRDEVLDLPLTIDEALRFIVSGGVLAPDGQRRLAGEAAEATTGPGRAAPQTQETKA